MEALRQAVKETLQKKTYIMDIHGALRRREPKPFANLPGRQRRRERKAAQREAKRAYLAK